MRQRQRRFARQQPRLFRRLGQYGAARFVIDPTDLPLAILLEPREGDPKVSVQRAPEGGARIAGPLAALLGLVHGAYDSDARFFSRDLVIEGDTEAVLALRAAVKAGAHAVILADLGLLAHTADKHPNLRRHLSVQAAAANADVINFYAETFGVKRVVLPRVLSVPEIAAINAETDVETEVFVFGGLCVMAEGRCSLSSYATGKSPNMNGVCSPPSHVEYREEGSDLDARLGGYVIHRAGKGEPAP